MRNDTLAQAIVRAGLLALAVVLVGSGCAPAPRCPCGSTAPCQMGCAGRAEQIDAADPAPDAQAPPKPSAKKDEPTHEPAGAIAIPLGDQKVAIHSFCLDGKGNLLAACGGERMVYARGPNGLEVKLVREPSGIRVLSPDGKLLATWPLEVTPSAVNVAPDGTIYCGGQGRLARLGPDGNVLKTAAAPQVAHLPPASEEPKPPAMGEDAKKARIAELNQRIAAARTDLQALHKDRQAKKDDATALAALDARIESALNAYRRLYEELHELTTDPKQLAVERRAARLRSQAVTGIAATERDLFVATAATQGYGYDVWRLDRDFAHPEKIVSNLRGCCGQMDIQAAGDSLYVAENARHRVVRYDREGKQLAAWGQTDREGLEGFGSCCNPMNLRVGPDGALYTSEASLGRIKRYTVDGEFLGLVGKTTIVPGCKHVAIGVSRDASRVYLLDITRTNILVLARRGPTAP